MAAAACVATKLGSWGASSSIYEPLLLLSFTSHGLKPDQQVIVNGAFVHIPLLAHDVRLVDNDG